MKTRVVKNLSRRRQQGVVLVIAMILLVVLSLVSIASIRSASSTEIAANNARQQGLAMQAAEAALRYCETGALNFMQSPTMTFTITPEAQPSTASATYSWQILSNWDGATSSANANLRILTDAEVNTATGAAKLYKRYPECMVQYQYHAPANLNRVVVTARGFGPDVAVVDANRTAPKGSEVWLQSTLRYQPPSP
jgi:type IV pilus assembly protein PilX